MRERFETEDEDGPLTEFSVLLDDQTVARLMRLSEMCHTPPRVVLASIIHDVLKDDEDAHLLESHSGTPETPTALN